jgi:signal transduction histidine kinase
MRRFLRVLTSRYALALSLVGALAGGSFLVLHVAISAQERTAAAINIAGRQRMMSQRIAFMVAQLEHAPGRADLVSELEVVIPRMRRAHLGLMIGDETLGLAPASENVLALFTSGAHSLDEQVSVYLRRAEAIARDGHGTEADRAGIMRSATTGLIEELDRVVNTLQAESDERVVHLQRVHAGILLSTLALLVGLAVWVFRPMRRHAQALFSRCIDLAHAEAAKDSQLKAAASVQMRARLSALGEMASGVAHELNNPLLIVQGTLAQLSRPPTSGVSTSERFEAGFKTLDATIGRMAQVVRGLMLFAREDEHERFRRVSARDLVHQSADLVRARFTHHGVTVQIKDIDPSLTLECQRVHLADVLVNLLINAFTAVTGTPHPWIAIECCGVGENVEIAVSDSGPGIDPSIREKIMRPFFTTKPVGQGVGLGLSIAFGIVEAHHGALRLDDASPRTRFVVTLPKSQPYSHLRSA